MGLRKRTAMRFQVEALEVRLAPGGRGGLGGEVLQVLHVAPRQAQVAPPGGGAVRAGQEDNAVNAGTASLFQKVREA
jgi:hypothetical protein